MATGKLRKNDKDRFLFGVCGGVAEHLDVDPVLVRLAFVLLVFAGGAGIIAYIVLAVIMPSAVTSATEPAAVVRENIQSMPQEAAAAGKRLAETVQRPSGQGEGQASGGDVRERRRNVLALVLVLIGVLFLLANLGVFSWWRWGWGRFWPLLLVAAGVLILLGRSRRA
jgi:phage shock protein C